MIGYISGLFKRWMCYILFLFSLLFCFCDSNLIFLVHALCLEILVVFVQWFCWDWGGRGDVGCVANWCSFPAMS
jgi:hypothetical protein